MSLQPTQFLAGVDVPDPDRLVLTAGDCLAAVQRKCQPIRLAQILGEQAHCAVVTQPVNTLKGNFLFFPSHKVKRRISKVQSPIRSHDHVVRTVEFLPFIVVGKNLVFPIRRDFDNGSQHACAIDQPALPVEGIPIRIAQCDEFFFATIRPDLENLVDLLVAHI